MGWCRLKVAGVEHCGLCGLAHLGHGRTCPHLNSNAQVTRLLQALKESTEPRDLIEQATRHLRTIRVDLMARSRAREVREVQTQRPQQQSRPLGPPHLPPRLPRMNRAEGYGGSSLDEL